MWLVAFRGPTGAQWLQAAHCDDILMMSLPPQGGYFRWRMKIDKSCATETDILWWLRKQVIVSFGSTKYKTHSQKTTIVTARECTEHIPLSTAPYVQPLRQKIKTFEKLGTLGFWTSTTSWKRPFCLIPSKNHFLIFATPHRRCFPPPCNPWGPPKTKICRLQTTKSGVIKRLHSIISGSCRLQILWRLHMRVAHSCCPPFAMLAFFSSAHVRRR